MAITPQEEHLSLQPGDSARQWRGSKLVVGRRCDGGMIGHSHWFRLVFAIADQVLCGPCMRRYRLLCEISKAIRYDS